MAATTLLAFHTWLLHALLHTVQHTPVHYWTTLHAGTTKKLRVTRRLHDAASGGTVPVQEVVQLDVKPGWKEGTRVTFEGKGDELPGRLDLQRMVHVSCHSCAVGACR